MAKVAVSFDTNDKTLSVTIDGKAVADVYGVDIYRCFDTDSEYRCSIMSETKDPVHDMYTQTRLYASKSTEAKLLSATASESKEHAEFIVVKDKTQFEKDVASFIVGA